jgi:hypothetical protein
METGSANKQLKRATDDYFKMAGTALDGMGQGGLMGMRTVLALTEHVSVTAYVDGLLSRLKDS